MNFTLLDYPQLISHDNPFREEIWKELIRQRSRSYYCVIYVFELIQMIAHIL